MTTQLATKSIYQVTEGILSLIAGDLQTNSAKAYLARLRQSINQDVHRATDVFPLVFSNIPDEYLGESGELTIGERSIVVALQLFALHQQGGTKHVHEKKDPHAEGVRSNLGTSFHALRTGDDSQAVDRRFNAMITASSFEELTNHLRHLIKLLKARTDTKVDYAQLAQDLYWFQMGYQSSIRLKWSRAYYRQSIEYKEGKSDEEQ
ncbi:MAG: type I-E CRISPR-associated protein Cse2/CasB [Limnochordia bacterium]|jgi:CRISPR system Cascade subunit CasB